MIRVNDGQSRFSGPEGRVGNVASVAVLDIGSNSVRMVVYEINGLAPSPVYNEKSACMLGRGEAQSGNIAPENARLALCAIQRFVVALKQFDAAPLHVIATSAVREAANGAGFMARVKEITGVDGHVLSGVQEAHFAALGVVSSMADFCGVVGDLGGGSLELAQVENGLDSGGCSLPLGVIRLQDESAMSAKRALEIAGERLRDSKILADTHGEQKKDGGGRIFCAIGGRRHLAGAGQTKPVSQGASPATGSPFAAGRGTGARPGARTGGKGGGNAGSGPDRGQPGGAVALRRRGAGQDP